VGGTAGVLLGSLDKASLFLPSLTVYADPLQGIAVGGTATGTLGWPGAGELTTALPLPNHPWLIGARLHLQGFFVEPGSNFGHTHGLWTTIQASVSPLITCVQDRTTYQQFVTSAAAGPAVWAANQVPGFTYVKTELFTCGSQSHWMVIVQHAQTGMEFCLIPGDSFQMGDNRLGTSSENPVHWVRVEPFLLARTEVTQGQFTAVMGTTPWLGDRYVMPGPNYAASCVDWWDSAEFLIRTGLRLPTEAEWEYACRAGTVSSYHHGEEYPPTTALGNYAWYVLNAWNANQCYAHQVGQKLPNAFGLFDMHGNVSEWVEDEWFGTDNYFRAPVDGGAVILRSNYQRRVFRGGNWLNDHFKCRSANRSYNAPVVRNATLGFRPSRLLR